MKERSVDTESKRSYTDNELGGVQIIVLNSVLYQGTPGPFKTKKKILSKYENTSSVGYLTACLTVTKEELDIIL